MTSAPSNYSLITDEQRAVVDFHMDNYRARYRAEYGIQLPSEYLQDAPAQKEKLAGHMLKNESAAAYLTEAFEMATHAKLNTKASLIF